MNQSAPRADGGELNNLELLGLLASRIIHDLKNKLAVISGHAQFAEMTKQNPKAMADAIAIIKRVSEETGKHVENLAKMRKALPSERRECPLAEVVVKLQQAVSCREGWTLQADQDWIGQAAIDPRWLRFLLGHFIGQAPGQTAGVVADFATGAVPLEGTEVSPLYPERRCLRLRIRSPREPVAASAVPDLAAQLNTLAACELIRRVEGGLVSRSTPAGEEEITLLIPLAMAGGNMP